MNQLAFIDKNNSLDKLKAYLIELNVSRIFLVHGKVSYEECGAKSILENIFAELYIDVVYFDDFTKNPKYEDAIKGKNALIESKSECIIAVGGGSAIDIAKLIRYYASYETYPTKLIAIPTTSGTGAEATSFAVMYVNGIKKSIEDEIIIPDLAVLYPPFTYKNNLYLTACTGFDALAQAIESYWNKNATDISDEYACNAIKLILNNLENCFISITSDMRDSLALGAYYAGCAINITKTTAPHAFSYAFTSRCNYPHGHAVALTFPFFADYNTKNKTRKDKQLRELLGVSEDESIKKFFIDYLKKIGLTYKGVNGYNLKDLFNEVNIERLSNNPIEVSQYIYEDLVFTINEATDD